MLVFSLFCNIIMTGKPMHTALEQKECRHAYCFCLNIPQLSITEIV